MPRLSITHLGVVSQDRGLLLVGQEMQLEGQQGGDDHTGEEAVSRPPPEPPAQTF